MFRYVAGLLVSLVFCLPAAAQSAQPTPISLPAGRYGVTDTINGIERTYLLTIPESYAANPEEPASLIIVLHGSGGNGNSIANYSGFAAIAEHERLIVVYPDALEGQWMDGRPGADSSDDVTFINRVIDALSATLTLDPNQVFALGFSSGGTMAQRLACALPERLAAVGAIAAPMPAYLQAECEGTAPIPIMLIQGTDDSNFPWLGIPDTFLGARATRNFWVAHNSCGIASAQTPLPDNAPDDGTLTIREQFSFCAADAEVRFYGVYGGGHAWPGRTFADSFVPGPTSMDFDASEALWSFFSAHGS